MVVAQKEVPIGERNMYTNRGPSGFLSEPQLYEYIIIDFRSSQRRVFY